MTRSHALALVAGVAALALPSAASAQDFCVNNAPGCQGTQILGLSLQSALIAAQTNGTDDRFFLAPGTITGGPWTYNSSEGLEVIGAGAAKTTLAGSQATSVLSLGGGPQVQVSDLTVKAVGNAQAALALNGAHASRIDATLDPSASVVALVLLSGGAVLDHAHAAVAHNFAVGILSGTGTVADSDLASGDTYAVIAAGIDATLIRDRLSGAAGAAVADGHLSVTDTLVDLRGTAGPTVGLAAVASTQPPKVSTATLDVRRSTIVGDQPGASAHIGLEASAPYDADTATAHVHDTVVSGMGVPIARTSAQGGVANVSSSYDSYGTAVTANQIGAGTLTEDHILNASPRFADPINGDFHLRADSSLIDAGAPEPLPAATSDLDGNPRPTDGNGDCTAATDIGAFERAAPAAASGACAGAPAPVPSGVGTSAAPAGAGVSGSALPIDLGALTAVLAHGPRITQLRVAPRRLVARTAASVRFTLSEAATVRMTLAHAGSRGAPAIVRARLTAKKPAGAGRIGLARRLHLRPGRYVVTLKATDASGHSTKATTRFTVRRHA